MNFTKYGIDPVPIAYKEVAKFKFKLSDTEKVVTNTRKSLISLFQKIISFFIDIILTLHVIIELLNLRKAKTEVIEKSFYIVEEDENQENRTYSNSINSSNNNNFVKTENEIKIEIEIEMKQKKILDLKMQDINKRFSKDISNFNSINDNNNDSNNCPNNNSNINKNIQEDFIYEENNNNNASNSEDMDLDIDYIIKKIEQTRKKLKI